MDRDLPRRINPDAILEAIIEVRFELQTLPEIFLGQLLSSPALAGLRPVRLPQADIPAAARESDANFRYQPSYQLEGEQELIRIGSSMLSIHRLPPYCGWEKFLPRAAQIVGACWDGCGRPSLTHCGLRYINALRSDTHGVRTIEDLNLSVSIAGEALVDVTVSYTDTQLPGTRALVRVASQNHVQGELPKNTTFIVDIDVQTEDASLLTDDKSLLGWLEPAHKLEKQLFFNLLPDRIVEELKEIS